MYIIYIYTYTRYIVLLYYICIISQEKIIPFQALNPDQRIYSPLLERCLGGAFPLGEVLKALEPWKSHAASAMEPLWLVDGHFTPQKNMLDQKSKRLKTDIRY